MSRIDDLPDGKVAFSARIVTRASRNEITGWSDDGRLRIRVAAPPVDDAANRRLVQLIAKALGVSRSDVNILSGEHSRTKRISVPATCKNRLSSLGDI